MHNVRRSAQLVRRYPEMKRCLIVNAPIEKALEGGVI